MRWLEARQFFHTRRSAPKRISLATRLWELREMKKANARRHQRRERYVELPRSFPR
jgi:hypothetical protein